ncbi:tRNA (adenosine(37)-N6)-threonylcarbamoyltransferase complex ATPase subunit type 1 TsaE [Prochlorococcus sp. MIT 1223]|uniref:tRNA (adenosine(37)-N6)-threonylcarbamoyltransferase complex ATPase subunit type 1 TsaE n=1 Tax=Prochlorococcus sp. MIT 1223 TaxID=3096217 RepID=UPI002A753925|nr:tRNA (adenosine(37)-N6)-threonylcarbamoyltransferase complex ATPase subunit type 1 TsaE [Prochlorococcus sp. MIT 1223]
MNRSKDKRIKVPDLLGQQSNNNCWELSNLEETISFGEELFKKLPQIKLLLLQGKLGAGKTSLVKGIAKAAGINEPITSPSFPLAQHYPNGKPPLVHIDLYRLENPKIANELFLQEEEEANKMGSLIIVEWPERMNLHMPDAWLAKLNYTNKGERMVEIIPPDC